MGSLIKRKRRLYEDALLGFLGGGSGGGSTPSEGVRVSAFGSDRAALIAAIAEASSSQRRLLIDIPVSATIVAPTDPILLPDNLSMYFVGLGSVTWDAFGLPLFWGKGISGLQVRNAVIYFAGTAATALPASNSNFYNNVLQRVSNGFPSRDVMAAFALFGCKDVSFIGSRFLASDPASPAKCMQRAVTIANYENGTRSSNIGFENTTLDGVTMGILSWGVDNLRLGDVRSKRWGQLNVSTYPWEVACHGVYDTPQARSVNITAGALIDEGTEVPANTSNQNSHSFKFIDVDGGSVGSINSQRNCGALEYRTKGTPAQKFEFGSIDWTGTSGAALSNAGPINCNAVTSGISGQCEHTRFSKITLRMPDDCTTPMLSGASGGVGAVDDPIRSVSYDDIEMYYNGSGRSSSSALIQTTVKGCQIKATLFAPNWNVANALIVRIDGGGDDNTMDITTQGPAFATVRFVELDTAASSGNFATFREFGTANVRTVGPTT